MAGFADELMIRYIDPAQVDALLVPASDTMRARMRALLAEVYEPRLLAVESVDAVTVTGRRFQVPVVEPVTVRGTWEQTMPLMARGIGSVIVPDRARTGWIDLAVETTVSVRVSPTAALLDEVASTSLFDLSEQEFVARFAFLDLTDLMHTANVHSYQELQELSPQLYRLHYADPPAFDPGDPAAVRTYRLSVSVVAFADLDVVGALREIRRLRTALDAQRPRPEGYEGGDILGASAWLAVFPKGSTSQTLTETAVASLFAAERTMVVFETA